jgi:cyclopropane-fatty-acyl-phospholipid synthase
MKYRQRLSQLTSDLIDRGPLYAIANDRIHSPRPLAAIENWQFWNQPRPDWFASLARAYPPEASRKAYLEAMLTQDHARGIESHYDVSNEFYALFLDKQYKFYTAAEFRNDCETLEEAQTNKAEFLHQLLNLNGDESVLDLGCGWGAMLNFLQAAGHRGDLTGFTLSKEQLVYDRETLGLNVSLTNFITDPSDQAPYDRIVGVYFPRKPSSKYRLSGGRLMLLFKSFRMLIQTMSGGSGLTMLASSA